MKGPIKVVLIFFMFFLSPLIGVEAKVVFLDSNAEDIELTNQYYKILEDTTGVLSIDDIVSVKYASQFKTSQEEYNENENSEAVYWLKIEVNDTSMVQMKWVLELLSLHTQDIQFYTLNKYGRYGLQQQAGQLFNFNNRTYGVTNFVFDLELEKNSRNTFYVRIFSKHVVGFEFKIRSQQFFTQYAVSEYFFLGLYYGLLLIMAIYNLLLFITSREKVYFFYVLYVLSCIINSFAEDGLGFQYVWPNHPEWNWFVNIYLWSFLFLPTFLLYATEFLELRKGYKKLFYLVWLSPVLYFITFIFNIQFDLFDLYLLPFLVTYIVGVYVYAKGYKPARFFVLGFSFVFVGLIIYQLRVYGVINHNLFTVYSFNYGIVLEVVVLSIALGDRIKIMKAEKEQTNLLLIDRLKENQDLQQKVNKELESKVSERTKELMVKSNELEEANVKLHKLTEELNQFASKLDYDNWELNKKVAEETKARILAKEVSFEAFNKIFPNELACFKFLEDLKWEGGYKCKKCGNEKFTHKAKLLSRKCTKCNYIESVLSFTVFHGVKFEITKAFYIVYVSYNKNNQYTIDALAELLQISKTTCWKFRKKVLEKETNMLERNKISKIDNWELLLLEVE